tara:strand:+ start:106 stop:513 length:408 start_codon:yes stop_codon:yes gene_type:complete
MGIKIIINAVLECTNQESAKRILMEAMNGRLYSYLKPVPSGLAGDEKEEWRSKNWGDSHEPLLDSGWIMKNSVLIQFHGGIPEKFNQILENHHEVDSFTLSCCGFEDEWTFPVFSGIWMDDTLIAEERHPRYESM